MSPRIILAVSALVILAAPSQAAGPLLPEIYFPLQAGNSWMYLEDGVRNATVTVLPGVETVRGVDTVVGESLGGEFSGSTENYTNDIAGLRLHKSSTPGPQGGTIVFRTPVVLSAAMTDFGESFNTNGLVDFTIPGSGIFLFNFQATSTIIGAELVTVPLGDFDTIRVDSTLTISGSVSGQPISVTQSATQWLAAHIGLVKSVSNTDGQVDTLDLVSTNVPEPSTTLQHLIALAVVAAGIARSRGRPSRRCLLRTDSGP